MILSSYNYYFHTGRNSPYRTSIQTKAFLFTSASQWINVRNYLCCIVLGHACLFYDHLSSFYKSGCVVDQQPCRFNLSGHLSNLMLHALVSIKPMLEENLQGNKTAVLVTVNKHTQFFNLWVTPHPFPYLSRYRSMGHTLRGACKWLQPVWPNT